VYDLDAVEAALARPPRAGIVREVACPDADRADGPQRADLTRGEELLDGWDRVRAHALEADLDGGAAMLCVSEQPPVRGQRGHRRLLEVELGAGLERDRGERAVGLEGRRDDRDVRGGTRR